MKNFTIRPFEQRDRQPVIELWQKCNLTVAWNNPDLDIDRKLKVNPGLFLVGLVDDVIVASVMGGYEGNRGWINYLAVLPEHQNQGFGRSIMLEIEKKLKQLGYPKINLQIRATNLDIKKFYESVGYSEDKVISMGKRLIED